MRVKNTIAAVAALSLTAVSATAGGYTAEVVETPVIVAAPVVEAPQGSMGSMGGAAPLLIALGVIAVAAALRDDD